MLGAPPRTVASAVRKICITLTVGNKYFAHPHKSFTDLCLITISGGGPTELINRAVIMSVRMDNPSLAIHARASEAIRPAIAAINLDSVFIPRLYRLPIRDARPKRRMQELSMSSWPHPFAINS